MTIRSSNLALRFYKKDGWSLPLFELLLLENYRNVDLNSLLIDSEIKFDDNKESAYYVINDSLYFDINLLIKLKTRLIRAFDDHPMETDEEYIKRMI